MFEWNKIARVQKLQISEKLKKQKLILWNKYWYGRNSLTVEMLFSSKPWFGFITDLLTLLEVFILWCMSVLAIFQLKHPSVHKSLWFSSCYTNRS